MKRHGHNAPLRKAKGKDADTSQCQRGLVVSTHGRHVIVEDEQGQRLICHPRGKKSEAVVGDRVLWQPTLEGSGEGLIVQVEERRNLLYRQDEWRSKSFAANLDQMLVWIAVEPVFSEAQLTRALLAARYADIPVTIVLNKVDLPGAETARQRLVPYVAMGYPVVEMSLKVDTDAAKAQVMPLLQGKASLVLGPSGAGKSTLINTLLPNARAEVGEISQALNSGRHTTTTSLWYWLDDSHESAVIDSPGFQEFGLHHIAPTELAKWMPDIAAHIGDCRFYNCTHRQEPGCAVQAAAERGEISAMRLSLYTGLFDELSEQRW
ncbi:MAG: ribosome small subunit-dependent GTPase A [Aquabacterium sp.]|jgi:ribosome biogenesis GTPase|uniref:ribosome small subunit-dependent GTPase A n=1 Tax=Aquabacterium sp. TaxID=1872578 RepID=UPI001B3DD4F6|nr:ribosome small subunit-dependent GTPase A [Aquabacterium sp.]MBP7131318.1 ribosome small subunit-dependent GTPase A [Aquabacterium sp.]MBP9063656.1 ribosome small subunit-dependent GTPase A [Aquabacterium sp.]